MSLRARILLAVVLVLVLGSSLGLALAGAQARAWLRDELSSAQASGRLAAARTFEELPSAAEPDGELQALVMTFDGDRHLEARLLDATGRVVVASRPAAEAPPPAWFSGFLRQTIPAARLVPPNRPDRLLELRPVYANDLAALWAEFLDLVLVLALASVGGAILVFFVVEQALKPLRSVGEVLPRIGAGDLAARAPEAGPPELAALGRGVNEMAQKLDAMRARNQALEEQILTLQDEERADIARDLHDEIGPHLFAANVDAAMAASLIASGRPDAAQSQIRAVASAIAHTQRLVRDILARLRPPRLAELGLASAIRDLADFWNARRPGLAFEIELPGGDEALDEGAEETLYRVVQESLSNAVRHGAPTLVRIALVAEAGTARLEVVNDGAGAGAVAQGFGLKGMTERVRAAGGRLAAGPTPTGGWRVAAELPLADGARVEAA